MAFSEDHGKKSRNVKAGAKTGPVLDFLYISQETHAFPLKTYQLHFIENLQKGLIYFDAIRDSLYLDDHCDINCRRASLRV